jgi:hypothetical protein
MKASVQPATLSDYTHFHGMLCRPATASRCINSFAGGTILFMPSTYTASILRQFDYSPNGVLTLFSYYLLVLLSLTGLSTLLRLTDFRVAMQMNDGSQREEALPVELTSTYNENLRVEQFVLDYCKKHTGANKLYLKRRFEYQFGVVGLDVVMLHFECDKNKLHLVEVYQFKHWLWQDWLAPFMTSLGRRLRHAVAKRHPRKKEM